MQAAVDAADAAFEPWSARTAYERSAYLYQAHQLMLERREALAKLMTEEQGKPIRMARNEVGYAADFLLWFAEEAKRVYGETIPSARADQRFLVLRQPVGVVGAITPWNYPVSMLTRKIAPALAAGCTIVLKPAEQTPLLAVEVFKMLRRDRAARGRRQPRDHERPGAVGGELVTNPLVRKITFTGSTEVGKLIAQQAAAQREAGEHGARRPRAVHRARRRRPGARGEGCGGGEVPQHRSGVHLPEPACSCSAASPSSSSPPWSSASRRSRPAAGFTDGVTVGPLIDDAAMAKMERQVSDALDKGARLVTGGARLTDDGLDAGYFYAPTLLADVTPDMLIYREETFGPVAPVIVFDDDDEAIAMANDTEYGLASYVYTNSRSSARSG